MLLYALYYCSIYSNFPDILSQYKSVVYSDYWRGRLCSLCLLVLTSLAAYLLCSLAEVSLSCMGPMFPCILSSLNQLSVPYLAFTERTIHSLTENPLGLKLHTVLSSFLSSFSIHHINLWRDILSQLLPNLKTLISLTYPLLYLNTPLTLSITLDYIRLLLLPIPILLVYAHKTTIIMLRVMKQLGMLFIGKNWDPILRRVSTVPLTIDQLTISTLIFISLVFLFPTLLSLFVTVFVISLPLYIGLLIGDYVISGLLQVHSSCFRLADKRPGTSLSYFRFSESIDVSEWNRIQEWVFECENIL